MEDKHKIAPIDTTQYDEQRHLLKVRYKNGNLYEYYGINAREFGFIEVGFDNSKEERLHHIVEKSHPVKSYKKIK